MKSPETGFFIACRLRPEARDLLVGPSTINRIINALRDSPVPALKKTLGARF
jgi:hypothetical protein